MAQMGCRAALSPMLSLAMQAARGGFTEGPGWVPYNTATSKNLLLLRPGNTPG